jgi:protein tyrosine phosphatase (PTP) superfamily phosphohydrolase (DUF442 family)
VDKLKGILIAGILLSLQVVASDEIGLLELMNYFEYSPYLASSGQPTKEQLAGLVEAEIDLVVNLAPVTEPGAYAEEGELIRRLGINYVHIPVNWDNPPLADLETFLSVMAQAKDQRVLVHCYANARASAFAYLWRVLKVGDDREAARVDLNSIWDLNEGYELRTVPAWNEFIGTAEAKDW